MNTLPKKHDDPVMYFAVLFGLPVAEVTQVLYSFSRAENLSPADTLYLSEMHLRGMASPYYLPPPLKA